MATRPPARVTRPRAPRRPARRFTAPTVRLRLPPFLKGRPWVHGGLAWAGIALGLLVLVVGYFWVSYGRMIEAKLRGEETRPIPKIFARPFEVHAGMPLTSAQFIQRLNEVGYAQRTTVEKPGEFSVVPGSITVQPRPAGSAKTITVKVDFGRSTVTRLASLTPRTPTPDSVVLEAPLLATLEPGEKRRYVPLASIPKQMIQAVLAVEDHRFYEHPGVDPIRAIGAVVTNLRGDKPYLVGGSTLTQQIVKNTFLTPEKTLRRKLQEQFMALVLESRFTKDQILELYLNDVVLGQRGPFEIHGVGAAARLFFGKDVSNVTLAEAATIAAVIQSPSRLSPFHNPERTLDRRNNVVLKEMVEDGYIKQEEADAATKQPIGVIPRALENEAPYFVDYVTGQLDAANGNVSKRDVPFDVYTTLDLNLQRIAQEAVASGLTEVDRLLATRKTKERAEAALVALDARTGEILAMVGGRAYNLSQYNRAVSARRQPGSTFKPFVYLAAFEKMAEEGRGDLTPATVVDDEPTVFDDNGKDYTPANYQNEYDGPITLREALARSRNIVAIKVAETTGYDRVAGLWKKIGVGTTPLAVPSIALGVFEASPLEMATAFTLFVNQGVVRPPQAVTQIVDAGTAHAQEPPAPRHIAREDTTFLVTNMMRSVLNEGTGAAARENGFRLDAAGKTGTTNDQRDAWFVGFTPELLTVVWVGFDSNQPIGLTGAQAALPIWTTFMRRALAGHLNEAFEIPDGVTFADIDADTGELATENCPKVIHEAFLAGTEPKQTCHLHSTNILSRFGRWLSNWWKR